MSSYSHNNFHFIYKRNMKYIVNIVGLILVGVLAGCSKGENPTIEPDQPTVNNAIHFASEDNWEGANSSTRGVVKSTFSAGDAIGVLAYHLLPVDGKEVTEWDHNALPDYMYNQAVTMQSNNTTWQYSPTKYWPSDTKSKIKFFAYYPYTIQEKGVGLSNGLTINTDDDDGYPWISFIPNIEVCKQIDFCTAFTGLLNSNTGAVSLPFTHQLSQISFSADYTGILPDRKTIVNVTKLKFIGTKVWKRGYFDSKEITVGSTTTREDFFAWDNFYFDELPRYELRANEAYKELIAEPIERKTTEVSASTKKKITGENGFMLIHPQILEANDIKIQATISISSGVDDATPLEAVVGINVVQPHELRKGKQMNYSFTININDFISLVLATPAEGEWDDNVINNDIIDNFPPTVLPNIPPGGDWGTGTGTAPGDGDAEI